MKKNLLFCLLAVAGVFASCSDDSKEPPVTPPSETVVFKNALATHVPKAMVDDENGMFMILLSEAKASGAAQDPTIEGAGRNLLLYFTNIPENEDFYTGYQLPEGDYGFNLDEEVPETGTIMAPASAYFTTDASGKIDTENGKVPYAGTVSVTTSGDTYTIKGRITVTDGTNDSTMEFTYSGALKSSIVSVSTLRTDYDVKLTNLPGTLVYFGKALNGIDANLWMFGILSQKAGTDGMQIGILMPDNGETFADGVASGVYEVSASGYTGKKVCVPGTIYPHPQGGIGFSQTWYLGQFDAVGAVGAYAPCAGGSVTIENKGDDTYRIAFDFKDDYAKAPHAIKGEWTGRVTVSNDTQKAAQAPSLVVGRMNKIADFRPSVISMSSIVK